MSQFADASLVVIPSLFKAGKLYAVKPTDGSGDFTVSRAGTKYRRGPNGVYTQVAAGVPAIEYGFDRAFQGAIIETGTTNLLQRSEEFDNAYWSKVNGSVTANAGISPLYGASGVADKFIPDTSNNQHRIERTTSTATNAIHTFSVFVKADGYTFVSLRMDAGLSAAFNLTTGATGAVAGGTTARVMQYENGWWRISITGLVSASTAVRLNVETSLTVAGNFTGDGTSGVLLFGAMLEANEVATSYIPTTSGTANRVADVLSKTDATALIGQTEGTLYANIHCRNYAQPNARGILYLSDGTTNNRIAFQFGGATDEIQFIVSVGGVGQVSIITSAVNPSGFMKIAAGYKQDDFVLYVNGSQIGVDVSGNVPACNRVTLGALPDGTQQLNDRLGPIALYKTRLSNARLAALTTL